MSLIGLALAAAAWNVHPVLGLIVGFLFVGGAGWQILAGAAGATFGRLTKTGRRAYGPEGKAFIAAWESRMGVMVFGRQRTQPPPGTFQRWLREHDQSGIAAEDWIDRSLGLPSLGLPYGPPAFERHMVDPHGHGALFAMRRLEPGWYWEVNADALGVHIYADDWDDWCRLTIAELSDEARRAAGIFHATWREDGLGITYERGPDGAFTCLLDDGLELDTFTSVMMKLAWDELDAHGGPPNFGGRKSPTPITWSPPFGASDDMSPSTA